MISANELTCLMQKALADKAAEPAFFLALLEATVYAHTPRIGRSGHLRLIQFVRPDNGLTVLPFFSDEAQARAAAGTTATVVVLTGRQLFELTRGVTLMLNPNSASCTLYPEEIAALLDRGELAIVEKVDTGGQDLRIAPVREQPSWLIDRLIALYASLSSIEAAYLGAIGPADRPDQQGLLVAAAVPKKDAERVARATTTALQGQCHTLLVTVDFTAFEPDELPQWLRETEITPFYLRDFGQRLASAPDKIH